MITEIDGDPKTAEAVFTEMRGLFQSGRPHYCGSMLIDNSDPFAPRDEDEAYWCPFCEMGALKKRRMSQELHEARYLQYSGCGAPPLPPATYTLQKEMV